MKKNKKTGWLYISETTRHVKGKDYHYFRIYLYRRPASTGKNRTIFDKHYPKSKYDLIDVVMERDRIIGKRKLTSRAKRCREHDSAYIEGGNLPIGGGNV